MIALITLLILILLVYLFVQLPYVLIELSCYEFDSKEEFLLWLIPIYMPVITLFKSIKKSYDELDNEFNKLK